jgi:hypothetical protein
MGRQINRSDGDKGNRDGQDLETDSLVQTLIKICLDQFAM